MFTEEKKNELMGLVSYNKLYETRVLLLRELEAYSYISFINITKDIIDENTRFMLSFVEVVLLDWFAFEEHLEIFFENIVLIENLIYLSNIGDSQSIINLITKKENIAIDKLLLFTNLRSKIDYPLLNQIYGIAPDLLSFWYYSVLIRSNYVETELLQKIKDLMVFFGSKQLSFFKNMNTLYFLSTYSDWNNHYQYRKQIADTVFANLENNFIADKIESEKRSIAIVSKHFKEGQAVFKCIGAFIESLKDDYDLYLVDLNEEDDEKIPHWFKEVYHVYFEDHFLNYSSIADKNFDMVIFAEVGLTCESLFLSNIRFSNKQCTMYGHPVSTQSQCIDYFFVGELSETNNREHYYSEETIVIKGPGMNSVTPKVNRVVEHIPNNDFNIFIMSSSYKLNPDIIAVWREILDENRHIQFHIFIGTGMLQNSSILKYQLESIFPKHISVYYHKSYDEYMNIIKSCKVAFGSYRYGDFNTVVDSLWMGVPTILIEGDCGYQNHGTGALKAIGLEELIVQNFDEYKLLAQRLINDENYRNVIQEKIFTLNLEATIINNREYIEDFKSKIGELLERE